VNPLRVLLPAPITADLPGEASRGLHGRWLLFARGSWITLVVLTLGLFFFSLPMYIAQLQTLCTETACAEQQLYPDQAEVLQGIGLSLDAYVAYMVVLTLASVALCLVVSTLIAWRRSHDRMAMLVALMLVTLGPIETMSTLLTIPSPWQGPMACFFFLALGLLVLVFSLFPDGRFVPGFTRWTLIVFLIAQVPSTFFPDAPVTRNTQVSLLVYLTLLGEMAILALVQFYRYRRVSNPLQRQQTKWVVFGLVVPATVYVGGSVLSLVFVALGVYTPLYQPGYIAVVTCMQLLIPLSFGFSMLRYRLWDIDTLINRTLVYGILTASVFGLYVLVVISLGTLLRAQGDFGIPLLATVLVSVLFQPLRHRLQRAINRLMYGERDTPYQVISRLGQRLESTLAPDAVLPAIVETVAQALKLPYAAITLKRGDEFTIAASYGTAPHELVHLSLIYQAELVGELMLAPRAPGERFTPADRRLLDDLARQAGVAAHAVRLTADLKQLTIDLQHSRERLVSAREEERRRLRRDLHDGLGPQLASLTLKLETARNRLTQDPLADALLSDLAARTQATVADIRRLVYALRPPALDELGLLSALRELTLQSSDQVSMRLDVPECLPELPAAVEVAVYRIAQEALTNVVRHAHAHRCDLRLALDETTGLLALSIQDDGQGLPPLRGVGVGLTSMRERAEELGGTWSIEQAPTRGTYVLARLPYVRSEAADALDIAMGGVPQGEE
jgi:signal transduction histidine kinase